MSEFVELEVYTQIARIGKALASPVRLRLLDLLDTGECDVEKLASQAGISLKNTSAQLQQLRNAHLVTGRREGNRIYYRLSDPEISDFLGTFHNFAESRLADLRTAVADLLGDPGVMEPVTVEELQERIKDPETLVVDVRSAQDYAQGHIPGAVSVPADELQERIDRLRRDVQIIAYCQGPYCVVSPDAVLFLRKKGFKARPLDRGLTGWQRHGKRVETDEKSPE